MCLLGLNPLWALNSLGRASLRSFTRLTVCMWAQIGGGDVSHGYPGCERALDVIIAALDVSDDMGLAAAAVNAVATIGYSNEPFRPKCIGALQRLKARAKTIDGFFFVESMIDNQLENLTGGGIGGQINKGRGGGDTGAKSSLERQFSQAAMGGFLGNTSPPPPMEDDWMSGIEEDDTQAKGQVVAGAKASATSYAKNKKPWDL